MSVLSIFNIKAIPAEQSEFYEAEIYFDGRLVGTIKRTPEQHSFELFCNTDPGDHKKALAWIKNKSCKTFMEYAHPIITQQLESLVNLSKFKKRLKKFTFFSLPDGTILKLTEPYSERARKYVQQNHPQAVILNTLAEDDAYDRYQSYLNKKKTQDAA